MHRSYAYPLNLCMIQLTVLQPKRSGQLPAEELTVRSSVQTGKKFFWLLLLFIVPALVKAQPVITSFSPASGPVGTSVTITGSGFGASAASNIVYFGAVRATVTLASANSLTVTVPAGAAYAPLSVTSASLTGYSRGYYAPTFTTCSSILSGGTPFTSAATAPVGGTGTRISSADIDGDGMPDLVSFNNFSVHIFRNTTTGSGNDISFAAREQLSLPAGTTSHQHYGAVVTDLDGDGKPDIAFVNNINSRVLVYRNQSTSGNISFSAATVITGFSGPIAVTSGDFNGDGKVDLAVLNSNTNTVSILRNGSSTGNIDFTFEASFPTGSSPFEILAADFDGDGKTDLSISNNTTSGTVTTFRNTQSGGTISFAAGVSVAAGTSPGGMATADFDNDGATDLVVVNSDGLSFLRNANTGAINFTRTAFTPPGSLPLRGRVAVADFDGDNRPDVVVGSNASAVYCFKNITTASGNITFNTTTVAVPTGVANGQPVGVCTGDFNNDEKPDIADVNAGSANLDVFINKVSKVIVNSLSSATGTEGTALTIIGTGLSCIEKVTIGGVEASFVDATENTVNVVTGAGATGNVELFTNSGSKYVGPKFTFVVAPSNMTYAVSTVLKDIVEVTYGTQSFTHSPSLNDGGGGIVFGIDSGSVAGITININTGQVGWVDILPVGEYKLKIKAANSAGAAYAYLTLKVMPGIPKDLAYFSDPYSAFYGNAGGTGTVADNDVFVNWMGQTGVFSITGITPSATGISIDPSTGKISWGNAVPVGEYAVTVHATNDAGFASTVITLKIATQKPDNLSYVAPNPLTIKYGNAGGVNVNTINWHGQTGTYAINSTTDLTAAGIGFNTTTGRITWGNTVPAGTYEMKVAATNTAGTGTEVTFTLIVEAEAPTDLEYDTPVYGNFGSSGIIPAPGINWHGSTVTYAFTNAAALLPLNITINSTTGVIDWPSTLAVGTYTIKVRGTNTIGVSNEFTISLIIRPLVPVGLTYNTVSPTLFGNAGFVTVATQPNWGGHTGTYSINNAASLPAGFSINSSTGRIDWDNTLAIGTYTLQVRATNDRGYQQVTVTVIVEAGPPTGFVYSPPSTNAPYGKTDSIVNVPSVNWHGDEGTFTLSSVSPAVTAGLISVTASTGRIVWAANLPAGSYTVTAGATNSKGTATATFTLVIDAQLPSPPAYSSITITRTFGQSGNSVTPTVNWGGVTPGTFETSGTYPATLISVNGTTGVVSFLNTLPVGTYVVQVRARNSVGASAYIQYTIVIKPSTPNGLNYNDEEVVFGTSGTISPVSTPNNGQALTYSLAGVPSGADITIDASTGDIHYGTTVPVASYNLTVTATNAGGTTTAGVILKVIPKAPSAFAYDPVILYKTFGIADSTSVPYIEWNGTAGVFEGLTVSPSNSGFSLSTTGSGRVKWNTSIPVGTYQVTVNARNGSGTISASFRLVIQPRVPYNLSYASHPATGTVNAAGTSGAPTVNWGGDNTVRTFELVSPATMPSGFLFNTTTGVISWLANQTVAGTYTFRVVAVNSAGAGSEAVFTVVINPVVSTGLSYPNTTVNFGTSGSVTPTVKPENGIPFTYQFTSGPGNAGISINGTTGVVSYLNNVPAGSYPITVTASNSGGSSAASFVLTVRPLVPNGFTYASPVVKPYGIADSTDFPNINWRGETGTFQGITVVPAVSGITLRSTGKVQWTSTTPAGEYTINVTAGNSRGTVTSSNLILRIVAQAPSNMVYPSSPATALAGVAGSSGEPSVSWNGSETGKSFSLVGSLPSGFSFNSITGVISWPATQAAGTYTVKAKAKNAIGESNEAEFTVTIKAAALANFYYNNGGEVAMFGTADNSDLPHIDWNGANGTFVFYDPTGLIPTTIQVHPGTGVISWPATLPVGIYNFFVRATNATGTLTAPFKLVITAGAASGLKYVPNERTVTFSVSGSTTEPEVTWYGEEGSFEIKATDPKPAGVAVHPVTGIISWSGSIPVGTYPIKVWATNSVGGVTTIFTLKVVAGSPVNLVYSSIHETGNAGTTGASVKPSVNWRGETGDFVIVNRATVHAGITIDEDGFVKWDETVPVGTHTVQVQAVNNVGTSNIVTLTIELKVQPPTITYTPDNAYLEVGKSATSVKPDIKWNGEKKTPAITAVKLNGNTLPAGQTLDIAVDADGVLSFPATLAAGSEIEVTVTVANSAGSNSDSYKVSVGRSPANLVYSLVKYSANQGTAGGSVVPTVDWNGLKGTFKLSGQPAGVTIDALADGTTPGKGGEIKWSNAVAAGKYTFIAYAENGVGKSNEVSIELEVFALPTAAITGAGTICAGASKDLTIQLTGKAPWAVTYTHGTTSATIDNITASPYTLKVSPTVTTTYTLTSVEDANTTNSALSSATSKVTVNVNTGATALINNGNTIPVCNGASLVLTGSGAGTGGSYLWSNGETTATLTVNTSGEYSVTVTTSNGCKATSPKVKVNLNTRPVPVIATPATKLICEGSDLPLTASGATTYQWYRNGSIITGATAAVYRATQEGSYTVEGVGATGCKVTAAEVMALTFAKKPTASFTFDGYCKGVPVRFTNTSSDPAGDATYTWDFRDGGVSTDKNPTHTFTEARMMLVAMQAKSSACPNLQDIATVAVTIEEPAAPVTYEPINGLKNRPSQIPGRAIGNRYMWAPADGLSNASVAAPTVTPQKEQSYTLTITTKAGCVTVDTQLVRIFSQAEIFVPKGFTPNNDGRNDRLYPITVGINKLNYFRVFNRWGVLVYETQQAGTASNGGGWDGTHKGKLQPMDSYTWLAEGVDIDGHTIKISGSTVLMR